MLENNRMDIQDRFFRGQRRVYARFDEHMKIACKEGLKPDPVLSECRGGYLLFFELDHKVAELLRVLRVYISEIPGVVAYQPSVLHTAISDYKALPAFDPDNACDCDETLKNLDTICTKTNLFTMHSNYRMGVSYEGLVFDQTTLILKGIPGLGFPAVAQEAVDIAKEEGVELRMPWGAHITVARFNQKISRSVARQIRIACNRFAMCEGELFMTSYRFGDVNARCFKAQEDSFELF